MVEKAYLSIFPSCFRDLLTRTFEFIPTAIENFYRTTDVFVACVTVVSNTNLSNPSDRLAVKAVCVFCGLSIYIYRFIGI